MKLIGILATIIVLTPLALVLIFARKVKRVDDMQETHGADDVRALLNPDLCRCQHCRRYSVEGEGR